LYAIIHTSKDLIAYIKKIQNEELTRKIFHLLFLYNAGKGISAKKIFTEYKRWELTVYIVIDCMYNLITITISFKRRIKAERFL